MRERWLGGRVEGSLETMGLCDSARPRTRERFSAIRSSASLWHPKLIPFGSSSSSSLSLSLSLSLPLFTRLCRSENSASRMRRSILRQVSRVWVHSFRKRTRLMRQIIDSALHFCFSFRQLASHTFIHRLVWTIKKKEADFQKKDFRCLTRRCPFLLEDGRSFTLRIHIFNFTCSRRYLSAIFVLTNVSILTLDKSINQDNILEPILCFFSLQKSYTPLWISSNRLLKLRSHFHLHFHAT